MHNQRVRELEDERLCGFVFKGASPSSGEGAREQVADAEGGIPDLLPSHVAEVLAAKFDLDPFVKSGSLDEDFVSGRRDTQRVWNVEPVRSELCQGVGCTADTASVRHAEIADVENETHGRTCHSTTCWKRFTT